MKKTPLFLLVIFFGLPCYSQISFENGYYLTNSNQKVECFIKNVDWLNNPTEFKYKLSENSEQQTLTIDSVKEFGILNKSKFIRYRVNIDRSSEELVDMSFDKNPHFSEETLFLRVLVEGSANLFLFEDKGLFKMFFNVNGTDVEQLVYKSYRNAESKISKNTAFRLQLLNALKCQNININDVKDLEYEQNDLVKLFVKYNECSNSVFINYGKLNKTNLFNLSLRPGLNITSLVIRNSQYIWKEIDMGSELAFRFGMEAEFIMPFNNKKWAVAVEPTYQYFQAEKAIISNKTTGDRIISNVNYKSVEIPFSLRYYMFLNPNSKIFINVSYLLDFSFNSSVELTLEDGDPYKSYVPETTSGFAAGVGYKYQNKYSCEFRYLTGRDILNTYGGTDGDYSTLSVIFGYSLF